jgi:anti-sigma B factor antagonist
VPLTLETRRVGDLIVIKCAGRIVEGPEATQLKEKVTESMERWPYIVLDVADVQFVDSAGLGLLVRLFTRAHSAHGSLKLCAVSARLNEVLRATRLQNVLEAYPSESEAIAAFYQPSKAGSPNYGLKSDILCVDTSDDVVAYLRELLGQAGYGVTSANNVPDALTLLKATRPKLLVVGAELRSNRLTHSSETFNRLADQSTVVEIPRGFSALEAGEAGRQILERIHAALA